MPIIKKITPTQTIILGFVSVILTGTILLYLPISTKTGHIHFIDALFTATSAVCVTGLVVVDTGTYYTLFGQIVIMVLIQIGGLGFMTTATLVFLALGKKITLRERLIIQEALNQFSLEGIVRLARYVIIMTFLIEGIGTILLSIRFVPEFGLLKGIYYSIFHSISAFCNAGFDLMGDFTSFTKYSEDIYVSLVISTLFIIGGIGYTVIIDVYNNKKNFKKFTLHSKLAITVTAVLILSGTLFIFLLEKNNPLTMGNLSLKGKIIASYFQAVTPRTAGFNTIPIDSLRNTTAFFIIILMFIGASPASTGGGIKTVTFGVLLASVKTIIKGKCEVEIYRKRLSQDIINRAIAITIVSMLLVILVTIMLSAVEAEHGDFLTVLFETTSAFGTVGLSRGLTTHLTPLGRLLIIFTMFAGRVGPLSLVMAIGEKKGKGTIRYPEEKVMVG